METATSKIRALFHVKQCANRLLETTGTNFAAKGLVNSSPTYILVGGYAAAHAAGAIRQHDRRGRVVLINAEDWAPYERPPLSKELLFEENYEADQTFTQPDGFYRENDIELRLNTRVTSIDRGARTVSLDDGGQLEYDKLLLAPGSSAKKPEFKGADFPNVHVIRTLSDSLSLREALRNIEKVAIVGGSYLGLEVASGAFKNGARPTVIDANGGPWSKFASDELQAFVRGEFERAGCRFVWNQRVEEIGGGDVATAVQTAQGPIETELVVAAIGASLQTDLAKDAGLEIHEKHGIRVDETLRTADPHIWVAGDCAAYPEAFVGTLWHNEHFRNAQWQGALAGANMAAKSDDEAQKFARAPYFFSDILDLHMILRGNPAGGHSARILGDRESGEFGELYADEDGVAVMIVVISRDKPKIRAIAERLEPLLWSKKKVEDYSLELIGF